MKFTQIFSDFFYQNTLNFDTTSLELYLNNVRLNDTGRKFSNYGGYQSNNLENNEYTYLFLSQISNCVKELSDGIGIKRRRLKLHNFWCNFNGPKDFNTLHTHPQSLISGVFYIKTPDNCGNLILKNRNGDLIKSYFDQWYLKEEQDYELNEITSQIWRIIPEKNNIILFPSWLEHYVEPNNSTEERISIAFNYGY